MLQETLPLTGLRYRALLGPSTTVAMRITHYSTVDGTAGGHLWQPLMVQGITHSRFWGTIGGMTVHNHEYVYKHVRVQIYL